MAEAPVRRSFQVYLYAVCFVSVLVLLFAGAQALFGLVRVAIPEQTAGGVFSSYEPGLGGQFEDQERRQGLVEFLRSGIIAGIFAGVFAFHWRRASRLREELEGAAAPAGEDAGASPSPG